MSRFTTLHFVWPLMLLAAGGLKAQVIKTAPSYRPGQQYELRLVISTEDARDNPPKKTYESPVTVRVVRKSTAGTDLDWVAGKSTGRGAAERADPILQMAEKIFEDLHLMVHLDAAGKYQGIRNEEDLQTKIQEFVLLMIPQTTAKIQDAAERRQAADAMGKILTPQALLSAARKEIDLYFGLSGLPLEAGKPMRIKSSALNPFGERGTLEGEMEITPLEVDSAKGEARVEFRQEFDPKAAGRNAPGTTFASGSDSAAPTVNYSLTDSGEYLLDLATGRVKQVRHVRTIRENGDAVRVETTEIRVQ
ncbi:MAG: hypothetical protein HYX73_06145 [Acidobacteria bacterium]|nr:hypothetical protein [Acidobacteriota bacterium]